MAILEENETDRIETTVSSTDTEKFSEVICAFSNDFPNHKAPGYLILGVNDNQKILGADVSDELLRKLGELRDSGRIQPLPAITIEKVATSQGDVAVLTTQPAILPPARFKGRICIRNGPRKGYANEHEERILTEKRVSHATTFDAEPCEDSSIKDLETVLFLLKYRLYEFLHVGHRFQAQEHEFNPSLRLE